MDGAALEVAAKKRIEMANFILLLLFLLRSRDDWGCLQMAWGNVSLYSCVSSLGISSSGPGLFTRSSPGFKSKLHQLSPSEQHHRRDQFQGVLQTCV